jgi:hypothetical protein
MNERVLLLGATGVRKQVALRNLKAFQERYNTGEEFESLDVEEHILSEGRRVPIPFHQYLDKPPDQQHMLWLRGWEKLAQKLKSDDFKNKNIILSMHGVLVRPMYGTRSPVVLSKIMMDFKPTVIITLIDNVYLMWDRTQQRAGKRGYVGKPTLAQLFRARRAEIFFGDLVANQTLSDNDPAPHYVISVWHPARLLSKLLFRKPKLQLAYMSFPISIPREVLRDKGSDQLIQELNTLLKRAADFEAINPNFGFFCPLTIDEYPLLGTLTTGNSVKFEDEQGGVVDCRVFLTKDRWDVRQFYKDIRGGDKEILLTDDDIPTSITIPEKHIRGAASFIPDDVTIRDYRLTAQSDYVVALNPVLLGHPRISGGVYNEIICALTLTKPVLAYQDKKHDPEGIFQKEFRKVSESMGPSLDFYHTIPYDDLDSLLHEIFT